MEEDFLVDEVPFKPGTQVLRMRNAKGNKLAPRYRRQVYIVIAAFKNNIYQLATAEGKLLKRRVNGDHLRQYQACRSLRS